MDFFNDGRLYRRPLGCCIVRTMFHQAAISTCLCFNMTQLLGLYMVINGVLKYTHDIMKLS